MKILYIVPNVNNEGGVARVLAIKANYLVEKMGYEVVILTQNKGYSPLFYDYNKKITFQDMILEGNIFKFFITYKKELQSRIENINPNIIIVADNGLKSYLIPFIIKKNRPLLFEIHSSLYVAESENKRTIFSTIKEQLLYKFKRFGAKKYDKIIFLTNKNVKEWKINDGIVISNPIWFTTNEKAALKNKKVIAVARHVYEKGLDRMLKIWQKVQENHPDWTLDIYGKANSNNDLMQLADQLKISNSVNFFEPVTNIKDKYLEYSMYLMTSRYEGFGMVLIEAMTCGVPCIAYDCPCGPKAVIANNADGFLIKNGNENEYVDAVSKLIEDENLRIQMGEKAIENSKKYAIDAIMNQWNELFNEVVK